MKRSFNFLLVIRDISCKNNEGGSNTNNGELHNQFREIIKTKFNMEVYCNNEEIRL